MKKSEYPPGWDEDRVRAVIDHYDRQTEDEEVAEYEAAVAESGQPGEPGAAYASVDDSSSVVAEGVRKYDDPTPEEEQE